MHPIPHALTHHILLLSACLLCLTACKKHPTPQRAPQKAQRPHQIDRTKTPKPRCHLPQKLSLQSKQGSSSFAPKTTFTARRKERHALQKDQRVWFDAYLAWLIHDHHTRYANPPTRLSSVEVIEYTQPYWKHLRWALATGYGYHARHESVWILRLRHKLYYLFQGESERTALARGATQQPLHLRITTLPCLRTRAKRLKKLRTHKGIFKSQKALTRAHKQALANTSYALTPLLLRAFFQRSQTHALHAQARLFTRLSLTLWHTPTLVSLLAPTPHKQPQTATRFISKRPHAKHVTTAGLIELTSPSGGSVPPRRIRRTFTLTIRNDQLLYRSGPRGNLKRFRR